MKQITPRELSYKPDFSVSALEEAIGRLYITQVDRALEDTKFIVFLPNTWSGFDILKGKELECYSIEWTICPDGVMQEDAWIVYCPDTGGLVACEGA